MHRRATRTFGALRWRLSSHVPSGGVSSCRCAGTATAQESCVCPPGCEFSFSPFRGIPDLHPDRAQEFCILTLRHPRFESVSRDARQELYVHKRLDREARISRVFEKADGDGDGALKATEFRSALEDIGMPVNEAVISGLMNRHNETTDGLIYLNEFTNVVHEAWGRVPDPHFSEDLSAVHESLSGVHNLSFIGRQSPASWVLRMVRNAWPFALKRVAILRNTRENPALAPELAETLVDSYEGQLEKGLHITLDLAEMASRQPPTAKGGLMVRIEPTQPGAARWPEGGACTVVPLFGHGENYGGSIFSRMSAMLKGMSR
eukprot:TRINITY_DN45415_c1_g1_i1.p1 TRINITY_DN45415_c1_g1~~TRINITY_DN45415_c1_g1_i1.p1  ORF type:complete len:319 (-),score=29.30 TRINITY_DN45415_c1_g1_i1:49-1005(-)